jgi:hypothetical protein
MRKAEVPTLSISNAESLTGCPQSVAMRDDLRTIIADKS